MSESAIFDILKPFALTFIPLFVAMEPVGVIPIYMSMTQRMNAAERKKVLLYSIATATAITLAFLFIGKAVFIALGITVPDFQIAGGLVLLAIAITDILPLARSNQQGAQTAEGIGIVPIGTPLIAGPAALTTLLMVSEIYGFFPTVISLLANLLIVWLVFSRSDSIVRYIGENGVKGISKVVSLLLAAIAVMMIRRGVENIFLG